MNSRILNGIFAPVPTPFTADGEVAWEKFADNIRKIGQTRLTGILVLGSNGEAVALREEEKIRLIALAREHMPTGKKVLAGTGCESLYATLHLCREAARSQVDAVVVVNPDYYRGTVGKPDIMADYYRRVADGSPMPVMIYNMPRNTALNIPASVIIEVSAHENIIGMKDSGGDIAQIATVISHAKPGFAVFAGSASFLLPTLYLGGRGGTLACANLAPDHCVDIWEALQAGHHDQARALQMGILDLNAAVTTGFGVAGLKYGMECLGYYGGPCRCPLPARLADEDQEILRGLMRQTGLLKRT